MAIYNHSQGVELEATENNSSNQLEWQLNLGHPDYKSGGALSAWPSIIITKQEATLKAASPQDIFQDCPGKGTKKQKLEHYLNLVK